MKIKKGIPLIDQHDKLGFYGGKFGGNYVAETLKKPIDDLTKLFEKSRNDKSFLKEAQLILDRFEFTEPTEKGYEAYIKSLICSGYLKIFHCLI